MIRDGSLAASRHERTVGHACLKRLFNAILEQWLVHDGQHLFGRAFSRGQKTRPITRNGE